MLPSVTKDLFSFSITEPASPAVCTRGCNCVISKLNRKCHIKTDKRKCERMQKRRERNGRVTNYSNNSSIKPPNASFKENASPTGSQKLQRVYIPIRYASFVSCNWQEKQTGGRVPAGSGPTLQVDTCGKTDVQAEEMLDAEKPAVFAGGLKGILYFIP